MSQRHTEAFTLMSQTFPVKNVLFQHTKDSVKHFAYRTEQIEKTNIFYIDGISITKKRVVPVTLPLHPRRTGSAARPTSCSSELSSI